MRDGEAEERREDNRRKLRELGFSEEEIARYEAAEVESARRVARYRDAAETILPVLFACLEDRRFFDALADEPRALVTLWDLCVQSHRNGMLYFVEADPPWLVKDVPRAARLIGETELAERFAALVGALRRDRSRGRLSARGVDASVHEPIEAIVTRSEHSLENLLATRVLALKRTFDGLRASAEALCAGKREAERRAARAQWDALRERAAPWSVQTRFAADDALLHAKFGLGKVRALVQPNKIEVEFEDGAVRTLVHRA